jgi:hypothetical protein
MRSTDLFEFADVFETMWGSAATEGTGEIVACQVRDAGETDGQDARDVELWSQGCIAYRPAKPDGDGKCQLLTVPIGSQLLAIASRDSRADKATGALNEGDAAFCSPTGKVALRCNADGSCSLIKQGESVDSVVSIEKNGTILCANEWGQFELGPNGFQVMLPTGESIIVKQGKIQLSAPQVVLAGGTVALGVGASMPLAIVPTVVPTGTAAPGFVAAKPCPNILI